MLGGEGEKFGVKGGRSMCARKTMMQGATTRFVLGELSVMCVWEVGWKFGGDW